MLGLDILPGSSPQAGEPSFAAVLVDGERVVLRVESATLSEVLALVCEKNVEAIAVDNVYELARDLRGLAEVLKRVPGKIPKLIEVTRLGDRVVSVEALCALTGMCHGKLDPLRTAEILALLASKGLGSEVLVFEEETRIHVGRGRVPGQGGMSRERFKRNIEQLVKRKVYEIREKLERAGLDYDLFMRKSGWGIVGATFIVYAPRDRLNGIIKSESGHDLFVEVTPVRRDGIEYRPLSRAEKRVMRSERYLIVGVDPGMTTGVAVLDFSGSVVSVFSRKLLGRGQLIRLLLELGRPAIVATDVTPPPSYVKKLASEIGAVLFSPQHSLSVEEKRMLVSAHAQVENAHQRDALAAALKAFHEYRDKFEAVEREAGRYGFTVPLDAAKFRVVRGVPVSLAVREAVREYLQLTTKEELILQEVSRGSIEDQLKFYRRMTERLLLENKALQLEMREVKSRVFELEDTLRRILHVKRTLGTDIDKAKLEAKVEQLQGELVELRDQLQEYSGRLEKLEGILVGLVTGRYRLALKLSWLLERIREDEGVLQSIVDPVIFVDRHYPLDTMKAIVEKLASSSGRGIIIVRGRGELETFYKVTPPEFYLTSLEDVVDYVDVGPILVLESRRLVEAVKSRYSSNASRIRDILEEYRRERVKSLKRD
ncbi:DUF460 domain-containing protein [Infirmifilum lucidum]|uniref:DUF460 domain-containing protein n=1 Tax=Infirmifilum lucidum TaxID=2776706 RepID=A0A7L9FJZ8_9CREN|nr:DUF460 domain-containing protein [Infirmifilum lucidum]QOJ79702.1 DUF460 domain-containing protein [Infirmifilum lucidum]